MVIAAAAHFLNLLFMAAVERGEFSLPAQRFRMVCVAALPFCQDLPDRVQLAMLPEQMLPAQDARR